MLGKGLRLYKREKLRSVKAVDRLFSIRPPKGESVTDEWGEVGVALCYPLRMVYGTNPLRGGAPVQFLVSVPKKKLRHAVDRVAVRRRVREAYRSCRGSVEHIDGNGTKVDVAFVYVAAEVEDYARILKSMTRLMQRLDCFCREKTDNC